LINAIQENGAAGETSCGSSSPAAINFSLATQFTVESLIQEGGIAAHVFAIPVRDETT
jgi:hypothetical protein